MSTVSWVVVEGSVSRRRPCRPRGMPAVGHCSLLLALLLVLAASTPVVRGSKPQPFAAVVVKYPTSCRRIIIGPSDAAAAPVSASSLPGACSDICDMSDPTREGLEIEGMCDWVVRATNRSDCEQALMPYLREMVEFKRVGSDWVVIDVEMGDEGQEGIAFVSPHISQVSEDAPRFCAHYASPDMQASCVSELKRLAQEQQQAKQPLYPRSDGAASLLAPPAPDSLPLPPLAGFWHIAAFDPPAAGQPPPPWLAIVHEQYQALESSDLLSKAEAVFAHVVGDVGPADWPDEALLGPPESGQGGSSDASNVFRVIRSGEGLEAYEFATLRRLEDYCMQEGHEHHWVWYMHTKGASRRDPGHLDLAARWRRLMDYHVITRHDDCLNVMARGGYMTCGTFWITKSQYYGGNSWWARCSHVRALPRLSTIPTYDRHIAEVWVGMRDGRFAADCYPPPPGSVPEAPFGSPEAMEVIMRPSSYRHDLNTSLPTCLDRYGLSPPVSQAA